ncbi:hypothetical protein FIM10_18260 [Sphingomonadales bacterium 56]|uniref:Lipoprotein n=3 Tax=Sphingomonadaceae TaxID=41297 RepID=A0A1L5BQ54_SPHIB|nr:hypothetical protein SIDU_11015 [Sphingobium indicum B90A]KEY99347.1 hypothetical protein AI27_04945 [Sphingomonas sp. BHC-A]MBY2930625.1 hypothetical protein [Sphingomonadales bacterium 56]MBY2960617.1 hypothetical protein [Sphingomonadales bacterium 58]RYM00322.1 hypothetical protein EWH08_13860 [Sphingobium indicum]CAD7341583.1 hypothetical protein SPHS8_03596 [Sphingobium sp. S8]CAD7341668.1 hypothetical protein SPHS6_03675 [Sphingobium sp. S6]
MLVEEEKMIRMFLVAGSLLAAACSGEPASDRNALGGAAINRADDAPGNGAAVPPPTSGSGAVPPNAPAANNSP